MWGLVENEGLKFFKNRKFPILILSLLIIYLFGAFSVYHEANGTRPENKIEENNKIIFILKEELRGDISSEKKEKIQQSIKEFESENKAYEKELYNLYEDDSKYIKDKIINLEKQLKNPEVQSDSILKENIRSNIEYYKYLSNNNLNLKREYEINAFIDINKVVSTIGIILFPILIIFFSGDVISSEYEGSTMKMLLTKPVSRGKIIVAKFISSMLITIILITIFDLASFLILGLAVDFGQFNSPMIVGTKYTFKDGIVNAVEGSSYLMSAWKVIGLTWFLQIIFGITVISFSILISTISKNTVTSIGCGAILVTLVSFITFFMPLSFLKGLYPFSFLTYSSGLQLLTGDLTLVTGTSLSIPLSLIVMIMWTLFCFITSYRLFTKQDVLI